MLILFLYKIYIIKYMYLWCIIANIWSSVQTPVSSGNCIRFRNTTQSQGPGVWSLAGEQMSGSGYNAKWRCTEQEEEEDEEEKRK